MRLLVLTIILSLFMNNALFAAFEEAECDMDIEVELLALQNKERKALLSKNKSAFPIEEQNEEQNEEQKSMMTDEDHQQLVDKSDDTDDTAKNAIEQPVLRPGS